MTNNHVNDRDGLIAAENLYIMNVFRAGIGASNDFKP